MIHIFLSISYIYISFRLVEKASDLDGDDNSFPPEMTHQIYGENEVIFGYKVLIILEFILLKRKGKLN